MTPEGRLTAAIIRRLKSKKIWYLKIHGGPMQRAGLPDLLIIVDGNAGFCEIKSEKGVVSPLQAATLRGLEQAGAYCGVIRSVEEFDAWLDKFLLKGG